MRPHLRLFGVPIRFEASFFVLVGVFGYFVFLRSGDPHGTEKMVLWFPLLTGAVLLHELGHALTARAFGVPSFVVLHALADGDTAAATALGEALVVRASDDRDRGRALQLLAWAKLLDEDPASAAQLLARLPEEHLADAYLEGRVRLANGDAAGAVEPLFEALADRSEEEVADALVEAVTRSGREDDVIALFESDEPIGPLLFQYVRRAIGGGA